MSQHLSDGKMSPIYFSLMGFSILIMFECSPNEVTGFSVPQSSTAHHHRTYGHRHPHNHQHHNHHHLHDHHPRDRADELKSRSGRSSHGGRFSQLDRILDRLDSDSFQEKFLGSDNALDEDSAQTRVVPLFTNDTLTVTTESWLLPPAERHPTKTAQQIANIFARLSPDDNNKSTNSDDITFDDDDDEDEDEDDEDDDDEDEITEDVFDRQGGQNFDWREGINAAMQAQADSEINQRSPYSEAKWRTMGSRSGVDMLFNNYRRGIPNSISESSRGTSETQEAMQHSVRMSREGACRVPRARVVRVSDLYPSANKQYLPACTILHQCGDDSGCCVGRKRCGAKTTKRIVLYFNTVTFYYHGRSRRQESSVEKLTFYNHTECECQDVVNDEMPRDATYQRHTQLLQRNIPEKVCRCPSEYTVRHLANGSCTCDCFDKQRDCIKYKKGNEYFSHNDRLCIEMETCLQPSCDFGVYMRRSGRCPKRTEKFRSWQRFT